ncbi:MAG: hypothetical protein F4Z72_01505 [Gemmatimonadales bacterium]|uniref:hypothetical protein n=1 Tax=Candidatus Palauibacter TaxID=3056650 RepID=UPI0013842D9A|nr:hypothetical protein [Candidatus Palauibacter soopunensis]MDE2877469.1 hypothetical protein [Candidatus Palauibacter soopunensis]MXW65672.1 hypothetical protein [Candidatus Palauibacter irciniicola]MYC19714.1 hypothetical protein [Gemmatimonadales bacterium]
MSEVVYRSHVKIVRQKGPYRTAEIPATDAPVDFGVHSAIAEYYGVRDNRDVATTLDYVIAATGG